MKKTGKWLLKTGLALLLCAALLCLGGAPAFAQAGQDSVQDEAQDETQDQGQTGGLVDPARLQSVVEGIIAEKSLNPANVSVGYCYLATGDTWYFNEEAWYYAASVYKVPLMMLVAEKVYSGELTQDTEVSKGISLAEEETYILTYSNNEYARDIRFNFFGGDEVWVPMTMKYSSMPEADYDPNFLAYRYFNVRYITDVLKTLATEPERFPNVIDCLLEAEPGGYFRTALEGQYKIAQKYGAYEENDGTNNNHTVGIIYTPNPIVLSVMTKNVGGSESIIGEIAKELTDYTLLLDTQLDDYNKAIADAAAAEEAARAQAEQEAAEAAARKAAEEAARIEAEQKAAQEAAKKAQLKKWLLIGGACALGLGALALAVSVLLRRRGGKAQKAGKTVKTARPGNRETVAAGRAASEPEPRRQPRRAPRPPADDESWADTESWAEPEPRTEPRERGGGQYRPRH